MRGGFRLHFLNGRVYVVNGDGHGVADFDTVDEARAYVAEVMAWRAVWDTNEKGAA